LRPVDPELPASCGRAGQCGSGPPAGRRDHRTAGRAHPGGGVLETSRLAQRSPRADPWPEPWPVTARRRHRPHTYGRREAAAIRVCPLSAGRLPKAEITWLNGPVGPGRSVECARPFWWVMRYHVLRFALRRTTRAPSPCHGLQILVCAIRAVGVCSTPQHDLVPHKRRGSVLRNG